MKCGVFSLAALLAAQVTLAAPPASNPGTPFQTLMDQHHQIEERVNQVDSKVDEILVFGLPDTVELVDYKLSLPKVEARVDTRICTSRPDQCLPPPPVQPGWDAAAMDGNDRPIRMFVLVVSNGVGVTGLGADAFAFTNPFAPAGGSMAEPCGTNCGDLWFQEGGNGLYSLFLRPSSVWKAGQYAATLKVTVVVDSSYDFIPDERPGTALVTFEIPPALNIDR
ncbi:MAG TPA: hypothetical protein VL049_00070 [Candidatus Dormibacteraeota bacterium]|nr:hypothetical protein [Candidatus Dormibacteraeota bacterium]